jgi:membrane-bound lytic murein transglycosylase D
MRTALLRASAWVALVLPHAPLIHAQGVDTIAALPAALTAPVQEGDLLDHIAAGLRLPDEQRRQVEQQYQWYVTHPDYLDRVFTRARRYLPYIVQQLEARGMPIDLALLPVVESAFDPFAYSHGRAAGLWQFIPGTARMYGLHQDWWYDGRRDVVESTRAALDYLEALLRKTDGDWLLAVASYNSGEGRVLSAMRRNRAAGKPTDFWSLKLPRETRAYVPKLLAISRVVARRMQHDFALPFVPREPYFSVVELDGQIDLALAAEMANTTLDEVYRLNPGFNRWATRPDGPHRLAIPYASYDAFVQRLHDTPADQRVQWTRYRIREGDVLGTIARRHGTTIGVLRQANDLAGSAIRAGAYLMIPQASAAATDYALSQAGRERARLSRSDGQRYVVKNGDSLWTIGRRFGVSSKAIARWNSMAPGDTLRVGRELVIRSTKASAVSASISQQGPPGSQRRVAYTVRNGDSLSTISSRFRVSVSELVRWNKLDRAKYLQPGQNLVMFVDVTRQSGG